MPHNSIKKEDDDILLPTLIDDRANAVPDRLYCAYIEPGHASVEDGLRMVTYGHFANSVNRCAWWLEKELGKGQNFETLAYVGPSDIRYAIMTLAAVKIGYKAMLIAPRNSTTAQLKLLKATDCNTFMVAKDFPSFGPTISAILSERSMNVIQVESLKYWLESKKVPVYNFDTKLSDNPDLPYAILHTSESTGLPEPITYTFGALGVFRKYLDPAEMIPDAPKSIMSAWVNHCHYLAFPTFHMIGTLCLTALNVYWNMPPILGPCDTIPTAELAARIHELNICQASILSPALLQEMVENHDQLQGLGRLKHLIWVGSPFTSAAVPEKIRSYVTIYPAYGATEAGPLQLQMEEQEFHEYMSFGPLVGATFRHYSEDLYELVLVKQPKIEAAQFVFFTFPKLLEWPSRDLFSKHPTKPIWRYRGRSDDTIVMANGLKINPLVMEGIVSSHPRVVFALLTTDGQSQVAWLIEVRDPPVCDDDIACLLEDIWPTVETANEIGPIHARVPKGAVVFVTKAKPMSRAGKGTVQRKITIDAYQAELSKAYKVANPNRSILPT